MQNMLRVLMIKCTLSRAGVLEVLHCVLVESPEALNVIKEGHIHSIISFLDRHGCNHKVVFLQFYAFEIMCILL